MNYDELLSPEALYDDDGGPSVTSKIRQMSIKVAQK